MSEVVKATDEEQMMQVLRQSLYPGARLDSVRMVIAYCRAQRLDPFSKPVHLVPLSVKEGNQWVTRDVIMPGINLYRIRAERTGDFLGSSEPEFGPTQRFNFKDKNGRDAFIEHPEWCRVTVKKLVANRETEWTSKEFWRENYQTAGRDTDAPNAMWSKRAWGQIAKCAEAQALRKAFPDAVGAEPTFEERGIHDVISNDVPIVSINELDQTEQPAQSRSDEVLNRTRQTKLGAPQPAPAPTPVSSNAPEAETPQSAPRGLADATLPGDDWPEAIRTPEELAKMGLDELLPIAQSLAIDFDPTEFGDELQARGRLVPYIQSVYERTCRGALKQWAVDLSSKFNDCTSTECALLLLEAERIRKPLLILGEKLTVDLLRSVSKVAKKRVGIDQPPAEPQP